MKQADHFQKPAGDKTMGMGGVMKNTKVVLMVIGGSLLLFVGNPLKGVLHNWGRMGLQKLRTRSAAA